ncbi:MAG: hypothetical protein AAF849_24880 [Bacteroidota bacterium]
MQQKEIQTLLLPILNKEGKNYQKNKNVYARKAVIGEKIDTYTNDGMESTNTVQEPSYVIRNQTDAQEEYVVAVAKFEARYIRLRTISKEWAEYRSTGEIRALELTTTLMKQLHLSTPFYFTADWGEEMIAREGDFLVCPKNQQEIYRIARKEFFETYKILKEEV